MTCVPEPAANMKKAIARITDPPNAARRCLPARAFPLANIFDRLADIELFKLAERSRTFHRSPVQGRAPA